MLRFVARNSPLTYEYQRSPEIWPASAKSYFVDTILAARLEALDARFTVCVWKERNIPVRRLPANWDNGNVKTDKTAPTYIEAFDGADPVLDQELLNLGNAALELMRKITPRH